MQKFRATTLLDRPLFNSRATAPNQARTPTLPRTKTRASSQLRAAFTLVSDLTENLLKGTETDRGKITLFGFASTPALNSAGEFKGKSVIPTAGEFDCTSMLTGQLNSIGIPITLPPNTCTATGATSTGGFELRSVQGENEIKGTYVDNSFVPAIGFVGQSTATIQGH